MNFSYRRCGTRFLAAVCCLAFAGIARAETPKPSPTPAHGGVESFGDDKAMSKWKFSNGAEWPGARGALERRDSGGRTGDGVLALRHDFSEGGSYVAALVEMPKGREVRALRAWFYKPDANNMIIRCVDSKGETFQKDLRYHYPGWQQVEVALADWVYSWSGDGVFDKPAQQLDILIQPDGGQRVGDLLIDDVEWLYDAPSDRGDQMLTTEYRESDFADGDPWNHSGPAPGAFNDRTWSYRFTDSQDACGLSYGKSILGRPATLIITVESDGSGHELTAMCGSHFQYFHATLGKLDKAGEQTFELPMGDMSTWRHEGGENDGIVRYPLRLENIGVRRAGSDKAAGVIKLKRLAFVTECDPNEAVSVIPSVQLVDKGNVRFKARLRNVGSEAVKGRLEYEIKTLDRRTKAGSLDVAIGASGGDAVLLVDAAFGEFTMLEGSFNFVSDTVSTPPVATTIAKADTENLDTVARPESKMGVGMYLYRFHEHPQRKEWMARMCRLASAAGVKWTREEFHWNWIEKTKGEYDFTFFDELVDAASEHGISVYGLMCYWTEWTGQPLTEAFIEPYCDYLRTVVGRYKDRIKHWEIWNEPNIFFWPGPKELYAKLCIASYHAIKEVDPEAQVLICSTAGIDTKFIKLVLAENPPYDALTVHPYRHDLDPHGFIRELQEASELAGGRDVWITEMGWPSNIGGLTERDQAGYVARTYVSALAAPATRSVAWYDFREDGTDPFYNEHHFGLVRQDLTPKIGYRALAAVGGLLGLAQFEEVVEPGGGLTAFAFRKGERRVVALWASDRTRLIGMKISGEDVKVLNMMGEPAAVVEDRGMAVLRFERNLPVYVSARGKVRIEAKDWPVAIEPAQRAYHAGDTIEFKLGGMDAMTSLKIAKVPAGWETVENPGGIEMVRIPADTIPGRRTVTFQVTTLGIGKPIDLPVVVEIAPTLVRG